MQFPCFLDCLAKTKHPDVMKSWIYLQMMKRESRTSFVAFVFIKPSMGSRCVGRRPPLLKNPNIFLVRGCTLLLDSNQNLFWLMGFDSPCTHVSVLVPLTLPFIYYDISCDCCPVPMYLVLLTRASMYLVLLTQSAPHPTTWRTGEPQVLGAP